MTTFHTLLDAAARLASDITINVRRLSPARRLLLGSAMLAAAIALPGAPAVAQHWDNARRQGAWGAARAGPPPDAGLQTFNNQTMRLIVHLNARARAARIAVIGATLLPFEGAAYYSVEKEGVRQAVNAWIRSGDEFDAVIDFDRAMRDPGRRAACCRPTTAATTCTRVTSATRRWAMRCRSNCFGQQPV